MNIYVLAISMIWSIAIGAHPSYILRVQAPDRSIAEAISAFYKGQPLSQVDAQCYQVPETASIAAFSVVIAPDIAYDMRDPGTIEALKLPRTMAARWFDVTYDPENSRSTWHVVERDTNQMPYRVPEHTIYILADPDLVSSLEVHEVGRGTDRRSIFTLTCKQVTEPKHEETSVYALMASVDAKTFHDKRNKERKDRNVTISMLYQ